MAIFNKKTTDIQRLEKTVGALLSGAGTELVVTRGGCEVVWASPGATALLADAGLPSDKGCKEGYSLLFSALCDRCPNHPDNDTPEAVYEVTSENGAHFSVRARQMDWLDERPATMLYLQSDEAAEDSAALQKLAYIDSVTGVPNRQRLRKDFEDKQKMIESGALCGAMAIFDLDYFKSINDTYGHSTGDIMLRRLTEHLLADANFHGRLYRLGGDEFVLFFTEKAGRFATAAEQQEYYRGILKNALVNYTMPNIELGCTLSMGAACYPEFGVTMSELLRKADIALYQAKNNGRNRLEFFETRYDSAKKFRDRYINIQPVLTPDGRTFAYEILDRGSSGGDPDAVSLTDGAHFTDALSLQDLQSEQKYFVAYTSGMNTNTTLKALPKAKIIITVPAAASPMQAIKFKQLASQGYTLCLIGISQETKDTPLFGITTYCKFLPGSFDAAGEREVIAKHADKIFIADGVDDSEAFEAARRRGFKLFQGFFFGEEAVTKKTKDIDPMRANYLRLLKLASTDGYTDFKEISRIISSDIALSYKLLRLLNSAAVGLKNPISSIDTGLAYLGEESLKNWVALLAMSGAAASKPLELVRISLIRARFGELLAPYFHPPLDAHQVFLTGMFSLLNIALDKTKEELFQEIPVADEIRDSILTPNGPYSELLAFFQNYEYSNWDEVTAFAKKNNLPDHVTGDSYLAAARWYKELAEAQDAVARPR